MEIEELLKEKSSLTHNFNYQAFADRLYDNYDVPNGHDLLTLKVCYAIYGPPKVATTTLVKAYPKADYERGYLVQEKIFNLICDNRIREKSVGIIFVYCYMSDEKQFVLPIFRVKFPSSKNNTDVAKYVDLDCRVYNSWEDWKSNNTLPPMKYSYPKNGYYSCSEDKYMFDSSSAPVLGYGEPRSSSFESKVFSVSNVSAAAVSTATAGLTVASLFMPLAAGPLLFCQYVGPAAAAYSSVRSGGRLYDKYKHHESLKDRESLSLWASALSFPARFIQTGLNAKLLECAKNGEMCSKLFFDSVTVCNWSMLAFDVATLGLSSYDIYEGKRDPLTITRFVTSLFFFCHTYMEPKIAEDIYKAAQSEYFKEYAKTLTDEEAQKLFLKVIQANRKSVKVSDRENISVVKEDGLSIDVKVVFDIERDSDLIRFSNNIEDPNVFFTHLLNFRNIEYKEYADNNPSITVNYWNGQQKTTYSSFKAPYTWQSMIPNNYFMLLAKDAFCLDTFLTTFSSDPKIQEKMCIIAAKVVVTLAEHYEKNILENLIKEAILVLIRGLEASFVLKKLDEILENPQVLVDLIQGDIQNVRNFVKSHGLTFFNEMQAILYYREECSDNFSKFMLENNVTFKILKGNEKVIDSNTYKLKSNLEINDGMHLKLYENGGKLLAIAGNTVDTVSFETLTDMKWNLFQRHFVKLANKIDNLSMQNVLERLTVKLNVPSVTVFIDQHGYKLPFDFCKNIKEIYVKLFTWILAAYAKSSEESIHFAVFTPTITNEDENILKTIKLKDSTTLTVYGNNDELFAIVKYYNGRGICCKLSTYVILENFVTKMQMLPQKDFVYSIKGAAEALSEDRNVTGFNVSVSCDNKPIEVEYLCEYYQQTISYMLTSMVSEDLIEFFIDSVQRSHDGICDDTLHSIKTLNDGSCLNVFVKDENFSLKIQKPKHQTIVAIFSSTCNSNVVVENLLSSHQIENIPTASEAAKSEKFDFGKIFVTQNDEKRLLKNVTNLAEYYDKKVAWILKNI